MPPEPEYLNLQLEALQRYVAELNEQRKRARAEAAQLEPTPEPGGPPSAGCCSPACWPSWP